MTAIFHPFHIMVKPNGPRCNLDCHYCFYLEKENLYPGRADFRMPDQVLASFIEQYIAAQPTDQVTFAWQGGEPTLLGLDFFKRVVELQAAFARGKEIGNTFQTNGVLLNDAWCAFFRSHNFLIGISIDGPEERHNRFRLSKGGRGTFKNVMKGLDYLKKHAVDFNTLTVLHSENSGHPLEIYRFLKEIGSRYMQFIPIVERRIDILSAKGLTLISPDYADRAEVTSWSVDPLQFGTFLTAVFDEWVRRDVGQYFIQIFDVALEAWLGLNPSLCIFAETCGQAMALEHNGDLYSCDHYVYPENKLGNIMEESLELLAGSTQQMKFGEDKRTRLPHYCLSCEVRFACNGECPKHRFMKTPDGEAGLNYLCQGYKQFFGHIDSYMRFMATELKAQRPPANIMAWAEQKDAGFPNLKPGVNEACPCGSGKKFKKCCKK